MHLKYQLFLSYFLKNLNCLNRFSKKAQISSIIKVLLVEAELFRADKNTDGRTDRRNEANIRFSKFCKRTYKRE